MMTLFFVVFLGVITLSPTAKANDSSSSLKEEKVVC